MSISYKLYDIIYLTMTNILIIVRNIQNVPYADMLIQLYNLIFIDTVNTIKRFGIPGQVEYNFNLYNVKMNSIPDKRYIAACLNML